ncbi:Dual specificity phosphatase [Theobroma cacao]|nr:Dual specificity phosphatase [Theobroma cacao]
MSFPMQLFSCRAALDLRSRDSSFINGVSVKATRSNKKQLKVLAMSSENSSLKMNLNEYMVTLQKPLGIRFGLSVDGKIFVHALKRGSNAEKSRIIMVGDTLKKTSDSSGGRFIEIKNFGDAQEMLTEKTGSFSLILERPFSPFPIHELHLSSDLDILFNRGRMPVATWNKAILASNLQTSTEGGGNSGFVIFSSKFLALQGLKFLNDQNGHIHSKLQKNILASPISQLVCIFSEEEPGDGEWAHGSFPLEEYIKALNRSKDELYYNHLLGMRYSKITEQIYVGSCIQSDADVEALSDAGITAVLNFQSGIEAENWGINSNSINESCQRLNILKINYPIKDGDSFDMRKKLPFSVGLLLRLLKKNHRVFVTCTTGFDRSPACVIAYLHWMTDTSLHSAHNFVTGLHTCRPDRYSLHCLCGLMLALLRHSSGTKLGCTPAIAWATWDLIAMVEGGRHDGPATHAVTFVWNGHEVIC